MSLCSRLNSRLPEVQRLQPAILANIAAGLLRLLLACRLLHQHMAILRVKESSLHAATAAAASATSPGGRQQRPASPAAGVDEHGVPVKDDRVLQAVQQLSAQAKALRSGRAGSAAALQGTSPPSGAAAAAVDMGAGGGAAGVGLVVDGGALALLLHPQHEDAFLELAKSCDAVICCRVSPMQKAQVRQFDYWSVLGLGCPM